MANYAVPAPDIPDICKPVMQRMVDAGLASAVPNQMTVNEYESGQGIAPHLDNPACFGDEIQLLSLGSAVVMTFTSEEDPDMKKHVLLPPRSLALLQGPARYSWSHGISARKQDKVNGALVTRGLRISLTFRQVMVPGEIPSECLVETKLEDEHVVQVYDDIAPHWHHTRGRRKVHWYRVKDYLEALEPGSLLADIGCGDGKYFGLNPKVLSIGCDRSLSLLEVSQAPMHETFCCDAVKVPLRSGVFDACICIAVLHHLANLNRRVAVVRELARIVRTGGTVLLQAWAQEQEAGSKRTFNEQDVLVPWKFQPWHAEGQLKAAHATTDESGLVVYQRYCHVYREGELEDLCSLVPNVRILESGYDRSNWFVLFQKIDDERLHDVPQAPPQSIEEKKLAVL
jgi:alkylated DNA repair protein alkB family protein 8